MKTPKKQEKKKGKIVHFGNVAMYIPYPEFLKIEITYIKD